MVFVLWNSWSSQGYRIRVLGIKALSYLLLQSLSIIMNNLQFLIITHQIHWNFRCLSRFHWISSFFGKNHDFLEIFSTLKSIISWRSHQNDLKMFLIDSGTSSWLWYVLVCNGTFSNFLWKVTFKKLLFFAFFRFCAPLKKIKVSVLKFSPRTH